MTFSNRFDPDEIGTRERFVLEILEIWTQTESSLRKANTLESKLAAGRFAKGIELLKGTYNVAELYDIEQLALLKDKRTNGTKKRSAN